MVPSDVRNEFEFMATDSRNPTITNKMIAVFMMLIVINNIANILKYCCPFKPLSVFSMQSEWFN